MIKKTHKDGQILGVRFTSTTLDGVLRQVRVFLTKKTNSSFKNLPFFIVTPNPEQVMLASQDGSFRTILNASNISIPDGVGILAALKFCDTSTPKNYLIRPVFLVIKGLVVGLETLTGQTSYKKFNLLKGRDVFLELVKLANKNKWRVSLVGDAIGEGSAARAKKTLEKNFKTVEIETLVGPNLKQDGTPVSLQDKNLEVKVLASLAVFKPHLLFIAFGAPIQEKWYYRLKNKLNAQVVMVVGGTFDYVSGKALMPPKWLEKANLEWLWRLKTSPTRLKRILVAFPLFPLKVFSSRLRE